MARMSSTRTKAVPTSARSAALVIVCTMIAPLRSAHSQIAFENVSNMAGFASAYSDTWGAAWGDLDGDHYPDIFLSNHFGRAALYRNNRDGTFTNVSRQVDLSRTPGWTGGRVHVDTHGSTWGDLDNDGDQDLYESVSSGVDNVWINDGGRLTRRSVEWGADRLTSRALRQNLLFDFNGDGLLDLVSVGLREPALAPQVAGGGSFGYGPLEVPLNCPGDAQWGHFVDVDPTPGLELLCAPRTLPYPASVNAFEDGKLIDVTAGFPRWSEVNDAATFDYDRDLRPDLFMVRRSERPSDAYQPTADSLEAQLITAPNRTKSVRFKTSGVVTIKASMSGSGDNGREGDPQHIDIGATGWSPTSLTFTLRPDDPLNRGIMTGSRGINVGYMTETGEWVVSQGSSRHHYAYVQVSSTTPITAWVFKGSSASDIGYTPVLANNAGDGKFLNVPGAGLDASMRCQSVVAGDFDNDMDEDLFLVCTAGSHNLPDRLFANNGDGTFTEVPNGGGAAGPTGAAVADRVGTGESVIAADYDVDGFLDLFVTNGNNMRPVYTGGPQQLFRNLGNDNHWIELDLVGTTSNRDAIGSQVYVTSGGVTQYREQNGGYHRWSQNFRRVHVGLGPDNTEADVTVRWPDGTETVFPAMASNTLYQVSQDGTFAALMSGNVFTDSDGDGLADDREAVVGTDPHDPDTDSDLLNDGDEVARKTNPLLADTDGEGLKDGDEVNVHGTNPLVKDTDKDTLSDRVEVIFKRTDPLDPDTDGDGLTDGKEAGARGLGTNPLKPDTDGGGVDDGTEVSRGTNPKDPADD
jgi:hypothetical protein